MQFPEVKKHDAKMDPSALSHMSLGRKGLEKKALHSFFDRHAGYSFACFLAFQGECNVL